MDDIHAGAGVLEPGHREQALCADRHRRLEPCAWAHWHRGAIAADHAVPPVVRDLFCQQFTAFACMAHRSPATWASHPGMATTSRHLAHCEINGQCQHGHRSVGGMVGRFARQDPLAPGHGTAGCFALFVDQTRTTRPAMSTAPCQIPGSAIATIRPLLYPRLFPSG